ncbi:MAG: hydrolase [Nitrososphaerota archaeon]|nr:hydrolase [Nitrososphaerota archaeon]
MSELIVDRTNTALVVIDLQKGIASIDAHPHGAATVISNAARLADAFRRNGMPVFLVHVEGTAGTSLQPNSDIMMQIRGERPPDWADIVPELGPKPTDIVITKRQWGAFYGTDLELRLRRGGVTTIVLAGISTSIGVESTARFAYEFGFQQVFAEDAMSDRSAEAHVHAVEFILKRIGRVRKTSEILDALA